METADAVVVGGGVMGTSIAFNLARRRFGRVILLEQNTICSGTSAKSSAVVRTHYTTPTTAAIALLARRIFEHWNDEVGGESGFIKVGMLFILPAAQRAHAEHTLAMNRGVGIEANLLDPSETRELSPHVQVPEDGVVVWEPHSGYGSPHDVAGSFARRLTELGGDLRQSTAATGITINGGRVRAVRTPRGEIATAHVVIASGPWANRVGRLAGLDLPVVASRESIVTLRPGPSFAFHPRHPVVADLVNEIYLRPETGNLILLGNTQDAVTSGDPPGPAIKQPDAGGSRRGDHRRLVGHVRGEPRLEPDYGECGRGRRPSLRRGVLRSRLQAIPRRWRPHGGADRGRSCAHDRHLTLSVGALRRGKAAPTGVHGRRRHRLTARDQASTEIFQNT